MLICQKLIVAKGMKKEKKESTVLVLLLPAFLPPIPPAFRIALLDSYVDQESSNKGVFVLQHLHLEQESLWKKPWRI